MEADKAIAKPKKVRVTLASSVPHDVVWKLLADFEHIDFFNPHVRQSALINGSPAHGVGATRQCDLSDGKSYLREAVIEWNDGQFYTVDIFDSSLPLDNVKTTLGVMERQGGGSLLFMETDYRPRWRLVGKILDPLAFRPTFRRMFANVLKGLEEKARGTIDEIASDLSNGAKPPVLPPSLNSTPTENYSRRASR